jgi:hypothetical protein
MQHGEILWIIMNHNGCTECKGEKNRHPENLPGSVPFPNLHFFASRTAQLPHLMGSAQSIQKYSVIKGGKTCNTSFAGFMKYDTHGNGPSSFS